MIVKPWRIGMHIVCVDTNWHFSQCDDHGLPVKGQVVVIDRVYWSRRPAEHSNCGLKIIGFPKHVFCDCHFQPAVELPTEGVTRRAPSPAKELEPA